jgi:hypothetical protein
LVDVRQGSHCPSQLSSHLAYKVLLQAQRTRREVEDRKEIVAASGLGFSIMPHIILLFHFVVAPFKGATHRERTLYWTLGKFFSSTPTASCSIIHKRVDAENTGFLHHSIDLDILIEQEDLSNNSFVHLNMPGMYILYLLCYGYCNLLNQG